MFTETIIPRFLETDALGHINNNTYGVWFEAARDPLFKLFVPDLDIKKFNIVMAHSSYDFIKEVFWGEEVIVKTAIAWIKNSSFEMVHSVYQNGQLCTTGKCIMIHYNYTTKQSIKIPKTIRSTLEEHLFETPWNGTLEELEERIK